MRLVLATLLISTGAVFGQEVSLPKEVKGIVGDFIEVPAKAEGLVRWVPMDQGLRVFPTRLLIDTRTAVVTSQVPGKYRLLAYSAKDNIPSDPVICLVVVEKEASPTPPRPNPPQPNPTPNPPAPAPDAAFLKAMQDAYLLERGDQKDGFRLALIEVYQEAIKIAQDPANTQLVSVLTKVQVERQKKVRDADFTQVRLAIRDELNKNIKQEGTATLDANLRKLLVEQFTKVIKALENLQ